MISYLINDFKYISNISDLFGHILSFDTTISQNEDMAQDIELILQSHKLQLSIQIHYNNWLNKIQTTKFFCPNCSCKGECIRYGYYTRYIKVYGKKVLLKINRVFCKNCHHTHALIPVCIVPYSQILLGDQINIILNPHRHREIMSNNPEISPQNIQAILSNFNRFWKKKLRSLKIDVSLDLSFVSACVSSCHSQFMQISSIIYCYV